MADSARVDGATAPPGPTTGVAWLEISEDDEGSAFARTWTGPLGLQIAPLTGGTARYHFHGGRLRATRCIWAASTVSGAELYRGDRPRTGAPGEPSVHVLATLVAPGSVFDSVGAPARGTLEVIDPHTGVDLRIVENTHLFALNVPVAATGVEPAAIAGMLEQPYELTPFQVQLLRSAVGLLVLGQYQVPTAAQLASVDRFLGALAGLVLRTARECADPAREQVQTIRDRVDALIREQAGDPNLSPASIAAQLNTSLRQLYRAFNGSESPATRIRRGRLERAAELLAARPARAHVEQVATQCGFASAEYFSRAFRREFGVSPRAYRSAHAGNRPRSVSSS